MSSCRISKVYLPLAKAARNQRLRRQLGIPFCCLSFLSRKLHIMHERDMGRKLYSSFCNWDTFPLLAALQFVARSVPRKNRPIECTVRNTFSFLSTRLLVHTYNRSQPALISRRNLPRRSLPPLGKIGVASPILEVGAEPYVKGPDKEPNNCWTINCL
jgi:hypothetical protein